MSIKFGNIANSHTTLYRCYIYSKNIYDMCGYIYFYTVKQYYEYPVVPGIAYDPEGETEKQLLPHHCVDVCG